MRPLVPRWHSTTLPVALPGARVLSQIAVSTGRLAASTTGVGDEIPPVSVPPGMSNVAPPSAVRCRVEVKKRGPVEAPTVVTQGPPWSLVPAPGPELPADALTEIPAWNASRNASSTGSVYGFAPPEIEKLSTSTPSSIACATAATLSDEKHPAVRQTR